MPAQLLGCPLCKKLFSFDSNLAQCENGHSFEIIDDIVDLMPKNAERSLLLEEQYWNHTVEQGWPENIESSNPHMDGKMFADYQKICSEFIRREWPDHSERNISIGEIACGNGSAISYLENLRFAHVNYLGTDISMDMMRLARKRPVPTGWNIMLAKTSGDNCVFREKYFDIIFCISVLHHFDIDRILECVSKSLKSGGIFFLNEPSQRNPFARIGRRLGMGYGIHGFKENKKYPLLPRDIKEVAYKYNLQLAHEEGLHFLTWPLYYILLSLKPPKPIALCAYYLSRFFDSFVVSPSLNYCYIQAYRKP
jgi:ubiquinone/menaquinone biosynthesis C-methylase UbiE